MVRRFAVAWYPIYRIPDAPLTSRFLTFHQIAPQRLPPLKPPPAAAAAAATATGSSAGGNGAREGSLSAPPPPEPAGPQRYFLPVQGES